MGDYENAHTALNQAQSLFDQGLCKDYVKKAKILARKASLLSK